MRILLCLFILLLPVNCFAVLTMDGLTVDGLTADAEEYFPFSRPVLLNIGASGTTGYGSSGACKMGYRDDIQRADPDGFGRHFQMTGFWGATVGDGGNIPNFWTPNNTTQADVCASSSVETINCGWGGATTYSLGAYFTAHDGLNRFFPSGSTQEDSAIIYWLGGNDLALGSSSADVWTNTEAFIDAVVAHDTGDNIWTGITDISPIKGLESAVNACNAYIAPRMATKMLEAGNERLLYLEFFPVLCPETPSTCVLWDDNTYSFDDSHPNDVGYELLADYIRTEFVAAGIYTP